MKFQKTIDFDMISLYIFNLLSIAPNFNNFMDLNPCDSMVEYGVHNKEGGEIHSIRCTNAPFMVSRRQTGPSLARQPKSLSHLDF